MFINENDEIVAGVEKSEGREFVLKVCQQQLCTQKAVNRLSAKPSSWRVGRLRPSSIWRSLYVYVVCSSGQGDYAQARVRHVQGPGEHAAFGVLEPTMRY